MKKLMLILVVLSLFGCASHVDEPDPVVVEPVNPFEGVWVNTANGIIREYRANNVINRPSGNIFGTYDYDDTYYYYHSSGNVSHIYTTYRYEFKENGTMLYLYWEPNFYGVVSEDTVMQKIGD